ncbi:YfiT family bacillithiol transferase [Ohtaekwangia koreensis]|uniref:DinB superfamily protein n=1 Tax=Ohtaekwangia koreensis TaxID=688867 RepID=A0A1T5K169_9BACT|nr:putative metal-dependent hydrolase [Ohtaekwangia koreensis]SKC57532.1 DinB superfamily protein [Ohtaekwangia koreensis]
MNSDEQLRYPIGKQKSEESYTLDQVKANIKRIEAIPAQFEKIAGTLSAQQLNTPYREGGWTARQVLHHVPDSHLNAYIRIKWALTEETPTIKAYDEKAWADTYETQADPSISIALLKALHAKWVVLLNDLSEKDLERKFFHPDSKKYIRLDQAIATYAWHGEHHLGHLKIVAGKL